MPLSSPSHERSEVVQSARNINSSYIDDLPTGPFEGIGDRELAGAIYEIGLNGFADSQGGDVELDGHGYSCGRWALITDSQGFHVLESFDTPDAAAEHVESLPMVGDAEGIEVE